LLRNGRALRGAAVAATLLAACARQPPTTPSASAPEPSGERGYVAYVAHQPDQRDLWLYDVAMDRATQLTFDGDERFERDPAFLGDEVLYVASDSESSRSSIEAISVAGAAPREIVREEGSILGFGVSPDGSTIAYLSFKYEGSTAHRLKLVDASGGRPSAVRTIGHVIGRGAGSDDEASVAWAPDGASILVTDTHVSVDRTLGLFLLEPTGQDVAEPWAGTHARWSPDGRTIYYRGHVETGDDSWFALDVESRRTQAIGVRPGANNAVVSPDGSSIAYDTSSFGDHLRVRPRVPQAVYRYDLPSGPETLVAENAIAPLWISGGEILVTDVTVPGPRANTLNSWEFAGTVTKVGEDGTWSAVAIASTSDAAALLRQP